MPRFGRARAPLVTLILIAAYALSAYLSLEFMRGPDGRTAIYTSNAFLLSGLLLLPGRWRWACLIGCILSCAAVVLLRGAQPVYAVGTGVIAGTACLVGAWLGRKVLPQPRLKNISQAIKILTLVIAPASFLSGLLSATWLNIQMGSPIFPDALLWFFASFVGTSMILPTMLMLATPKTAPTPVRGRIENLTLGLFVAGILVAPFVGFYYLALMLAFPAANLLALRLGGKWTAATLTAINLSAFAFPFLAADSLLNRSAPEVGRAMIIGLQAYAMVVFYNGILTALAMDQQSRTKRQLEGRTAMARRARAEAVEASRAKTEFLATMSHEVRTPLNSILGFSQLLDRRDDLASEARRQVGMIRRSGESLLTIVNDILDFSKVEAGKLTLDPRPSRLTSVAEEALAIVAPAAEEKGLKVAMSVEGETDRRHVFDDQRLRQVLLNFLNNAVKFTEAGRIDLALCVRPGADGLDLARIAVTDTGVGISTEALPRLFQRFTQADSSISRSYGGTGLGLSICKGLVELMGGKVGVDSREGDGSTFWFEVALPRAEAGAEAARLLDQDADITAHILLVDDNAANRELGVTVLRMLGCTAETARDGAEAVEAAGVRRFDLILMDVHMPGMDGLAATRAIRNLPGEAGKVPVIAMSADVLPEQIERCRAAGMVDHVAKPINIERLCGTLQTWLGAAPGAEAEVAA